MSKKYNHAMDLAFEVESDLMEPTKEEVLTGLMKRVDYLKNSIDELLEATNIYDTYEQ